MGHFDYLDREHRSLRQRTCLEPSVLFSTSGRKYFGRQIPLAFRRRPYDQA